MPARLPPIVKGNKGAFDMLPPGTVNTLLMPANKPMLTKYHGEGNPDSEWVKLQLNEYEELLEMDGTDKRWWDYRGLFRDKSSCYRLFCNVAVTIFGQWAGNGNFSSPFHSLTLY